jgi:hypothetical protein
MTGVTGGDREERAKEALIVSALRRDDHTDEEVDVDRLPRLAEEEERALESLGPDFIDRLVGGTLEEPSEPDWQEEERPGGELAMAGGAMGFGLDRAEEIDEETQAELDEQRRKILERKRSKQDDGGETTGP